MDQQLIRCRLKTQLKCQGEILRVGHEVDVDAVTLARQPEVYESIDAAAAEVAVKQATAVLKQAEGTITHAGRKAQSRAWGDLTKQAHRVVAERRAREAAAEAEAARGRDAGDPAYFSSIASLPRYAAPQAEGDARPVIRHSPRAEVVTQPVAVPVAQVPAIKPSQAQYAGAIEGLMERRRAALAARGDGGQSA